MQRTIFTVCAVCSACVAIEEGFMPPNMILLLVCSRLAYTFKHWPWLLL